MKEAHQQCRICKEPYQPHPRNAKTNKNWSQKTCGKRQCRLAWQRKQWRRWMNLNPHYSEARRSKNRAWAGAYPNYWRHYRATHRKYATRDNLRRVQARKRAGLSAKQMAIRRIVVEKLPALDALKPTEVSAKQTAIHRRVDAIEDCLRSTVKVLWSAKQMPMDRIAGPGG